MRVREREISNQIVTQVFISKEEAEDSINQEKIQELKEENQNVVVFSAGNIDMAQTLKGMLQIMNNKVMIN